MSRIAPFLRAFAGQFLELAERVERGGDRQAPADYGDLTLWTVVSWNDRGIGERVGVLIEHRVDEYTGGEGAFAFADRLEYMLVRSHDGDHCIPTGYPFAVRVGGVDRGGDDGCDRG